MSEIKTNPFKVNDQVLCIRDVASDLNRGNIYKVIETRSIDGEPYIRPLNKSEFYCVDRFKLVPPDEPAVPETVLFHRGPMMIAKIANQNGLKFSLIGVAWEASDIAIRELHKVLDNWLGSSMPVNPSESMRNRSLAGVDAICRGSLALNTGCGKCSRCKEEFAENGSQLYVDFVNKYRDTVNSHHERILKLESPE